MAADLMISANLALLLYKAAELLRGRRHELGSGCCKPYGGRIFPHHITVLW